MTVNIINKYKNDYKLGFDIKKLSNKILEYILKFEALNNIFFINIILVNNYKIKKINSQFRSINKTTDVLSFPMLNFTTPSDFNKLLKNEYVIKDLEENKYFLGDVIISIDKLISQSKKYNHSIKREYSFLLTHSILHLLGYDHIEDEKVMFNKQNIILNNLGICR